MLVVRFLIYAIDSMLSALFTAEEIEELERMQRESDKE